MPKKIGYSFSKCLASIARGEVAIGDVAYILTNTAYPNRTSMLEALRPIMSGDRANIHMENAAALWDSGRIFQPSARPAHRYPDRLWIDAPDPGLFLDIEE